MSLAQDDDIYSDESLALLGNKDVSAQRTEKRKLIEDLPNRNILSLNNLFNNGNVQFKLAAMDVYEAYGANSLFSYDMLISAVCDPDKTVCSKAKKIFALKGIKFGPCQNNTHKETAYKTQKKPNIAMIGAWMDFDYAKVGLRINDLKPETKKIILDINYPPETIKEIYVQFPKVKIKKQLKGFCRFEFDSSQLNENSEVDLKINPIFDRKEKLNFSNEANLKSTPLKISTLSVDGKAISGFFVEDTLPAVKVSFSFIPPEWRAPGKDIVKYLVAEKEKWIESVFKSKISFYDLFCGPNVKAISLGKNNETVLTVMITRMKTQGGVEIFVYRKNDNNFKLIYTGGSGFIGGYEILLWNGENYFVNHSNKGSIFSLREKSLKKVFEYEDSGCFYQNGCSFETKLVKEGGKLYIYRHEMLSDNPCNEDLLKEARWQKAEIVWNGKSDSFEQRPFKITE